jgi:hypothetical protein
MKVFLLLCVLIGAVLGTDWGACLKNPDTTEGFRPIFYKFAEQDIVLFEMYRLGNIPETGQCVTYTFTKETNADRHD